MARNRTLQDQTFTVGFSASLANKFMEKRANQIPSLNSRAGPQAVAAEAGDNVNHVFSLGEFPSPP